MQPGCIFELEYEVTDVSVIDESCYSLWPNIA